MTWQRARMIGNGAGSGACDSVSRGWPSPRPTHPQRGRRAPRAVDRPRRRVVVDQADAERLLRQALGEGDAVPVVGVPDADPAGGELAGGGLGGDAVDVQQERRHPALHPGGPVEPNALRRSREEALAEVALVVAQDVHAAKRVEVGDRRPEAGEQLVGERPRLEAPADGGRRRGPRLVGAPGLAERLAHVRHAEMRAAELVRRAEQDVAAERGDVDRARGPRSGRRRSTRSLLLRGPMRQIRFASASEPVAFDASANATTRVRSESLRSRSS